MTLDAATAPSATDLARIVRARDGQAVAALAQATWREPVEVLDLNGFHPKYRVPGRRRNGTTVGGPDKLPSDTMKIPVLGPDGQPVRTWSDRHPVPAAIFIFLGMILIAALFAFAATVSWAFSTNLWSSDYTGKVRGAANSLALSFADTATVHPGRLWLAWSPHWLGLIHAGGQPHILWQSSGPTRPSFTPNINLLTWPDGSTVSLM